MPPKVKFTKEEIVSAALDMARKDSIHSITARALGKRLGTSSRPVFTAFQNMEELHHEVMKSGRKLYNQYILEGLAKPSAFKGVGTQYIRFAIEEPNLFRMLFMSEQLEVNDIDFILPTIDENYEQILASAQKDYQLQKTEAEKLYRHLWVYTHGIAALCATKTCRFSPAVISQMMAEVRTGLLKEIKEGETDD